MAEIPIQEKKRSVWPIVLGVLLVLAAAWWMLSRSADEPATQGAVGVAPAVTAPATPADAPIRALADVG